MTGSSQGNDYAHMRIAVVDTGVGINPAERSKLFCPFSQLQGQTLGHKATEGGTGLGLVICKRIVEAMHGSIGVESQGLGQGSRFWFQLDLPKTESPVVPPSPSLLKARSLTLAVIDAHVSLNSERLLPAEEDSGPARVLVAEDNEVNALLVCRMLKMHNYIPVRLPRSPLSSRSTFAHGRLSPSMAHLRSRYGAASTLTLSSWTCRCR